jgi:hypothetical protein
MVLDCGAMGIVAPMVMDAQEVRTIVSACKYPPIGNRSLGGGLHALNYGCSAEDYFLRADEEILVVIQTEHIRAVEIADEIYSVPGIDAIFVGPNDLAASLRGHPPADPRRGQAERGPLRAPRADGRGRRETGGRGLAVHRRGQRAEIHARRCQRPGQGHEP